MLDLDLTFAILHHLAVFTLVGIIAAEFVLLRPGIAGARLSQLASVDRLYGIAAGVVILIGVLRVFFGGKGWEFYVASDMFWGKMLAFVVVGLLSIQPTRALVKWGKALKSDPAFAPPATDIARSRRFINGQVIVLVLIPIFAAAMARGY
jgi:putative membrane protein